MGRFNNIKKDATTIESHAKVQKHVPNPHGRPKKKEAEKFKKMLGVRFTEAQYEELTQCAQEMGVSMSNLCKIALKQAGYLK